MSEAYLTVEALNAEINRVWEGLGKLARSDDAVIAAAATFAQRLFEQELDTLLAKSKTLRRVARFPAPEAD